MSKKLTKDAIISHKKNAIKKLDRKHNLYYDMPTTRFIL